MSKPTDTSNKIPPDANCLDNHIARYLGCPCVHDSRKVILIAIKENLSYKKARRLHETSTRLSNTDKAPLQEQMKELSCQAHVLVAHFPLVRTVGERKERSATEFLSKFWRYSSDLVVVLICYSPLEDKNLGGGQNKFYR